MRILVAHPHLNVIGGSEVLTKILVYELASQGHEVIVVTRARNPEVFPDAPNVRFELFKEITELSKYEPSVRAQKIVNLLYTFDYVINRYNPNVVLVMIQEPIYAVISKFVNPFLGTALYIHYPFEEELKPENLPKFIEMYRFPALYESLYKAVDLHFTNSNYTAKALHKHFGIESNVVYPAVPWDYFTEEPSVEEDRENVIVTVGRFVPQKRHDVLIKLFRDRIKPVCRDARLVIVGVKDPRYEEYYESLKKLAEETEGVELIDRALTPRDMIKIYRSAKVYVHMRIGEHFGMAPVEAMTQATIPILPRQSGLAELITHGKNGFLFDNDDEVVEYVIRILNMEKSKLVELRKYALRTSWYFTPERFARQILYYLKLVAE